MSRRRFEGTFTNDSDTVGGEWPGGGYESFMRRSEG